MGEAKTESVQGGVEDVKGELSFIYSFTFCTFAFLL